MLEVVLDLIVTVVVLRAIWKLLQGVKVGLSTRTMDSSASKQHGPLTHGVQMAKDPVCGTYVVPDHAISIAVGRERVYFCSSTCRDKFRARTA